MQFKAILFKIPTGQLWIKTKANNEAVLEKEEQGAGTCNTEEQQLILKLADKVQYQSGYTDQQNKMDPRNRFAHY